MREHAGSVVVLDVLEQFEQPDAIAGVSDCARAGVAKRRADASAGEGNVDRAGWCIASGAMRPGFFGGARRQTPPAGARRSLRRILPSGFFGSASMNSIRSGRLKLASRERQKSSSSVSRHVLALAHDDEGLDDLAPFDRRHADDGAFVDRRMTHQHGFDFRGRDIFAAADDHVVLAAGEEDVAVVVEPSEVAGRAPSVGQSRVVVAAGVALHDARGADDDFADLAVRQELAVIIAHSNFDVGQRLADRVEAFELQFDFCSAVPSIR